jgi:hypothetical protein
MGLVPTLSTLELPSTGQLGVDTEQGRDVWGQLADKDAEVAGVGACNLDTDRELDGLDRGSGSVGMPNTGNSAYYIL